jgi:hypothetical protein
MTRSDANAIACRPDEQNLLIVTADALTGTPARRLAIRATFRPCSASGMAHPKMTSSTSAGVIPGARRSASAIAVAASSSGLVPRRAPPGALPTGVLTAATITASFIVPQEVFDCIGDLPRLSIEHMIRRVDRRSVPWDRGRVRRTREPALSGQISSRSPWMKNLAVSLDATASKS